MSIAVLSTCLYRSLGIMGVNCERDLESGTICRLLHLSFGR